MQCIIWINNGNITSGNLCPAKLVRVIKTNSTANGIQIVPASGSGNAINGAGSYSLTAQYAFVYLRSTGNNWVIVGKS
ncbi:hypothetical protein QCD57_001226 [Enterobacter hormaechei]|nr:hypothetical protein [Enterobacter hormaechei]